MRVTDQIVFRQAGSDIGGLRSRVFELQQQGTSGLKFSGIAEDPSAAERVRHLTESLEATKHYDKNITRSRIPLEAGESALAEASDILSRAKELALAMSNETLTASERSIVSTEVASLYESMLGVANTNAGGEYIFAGFSTNQRPFLADGTFVGDSGSKEVDVGPNSRLEVNLSGLASFTSAFGGVDVLAELEAFRSALAADDMVGIRNAITTMESGLNQVVEARTLAGLKLNQLDVASSVRDRIEDSLTSEKSQMIDIDPVKVFMELNATTGTLEDALAVSKRVMSLSFIDR